LNYTTLDIALQYAERGWAVFPCRPRTKKPATQHGFKDATTDTGRIRRWWHDKPDKGIAIATGEVSGLLVVDIDPRHGGDKTLAELIESHGELPVTTQAMTGGGGIHLLFKHPGGHIKSRPNALGPGIDIKADGGYIMAPPSVHPDGGLYRWAIHREEIEPVETPEWMLAKLVQGENDINPSQEYCCVSESPGNLDVCSSVSLSNCSSALLCHTTIEQAIKETIPDSSGRRNRAVFDFARWLKAMPSLVDADVTELRQYAKQWHKAAEPFISGEDDFSDTWADFIYAWQRVKHPKGTGPMAELMKKADAADPPECPTDYGTTARKLVSLCRELQHNASDKPFFIAYRTVAELLGVDRNKAGRLLNMLCVDGLIERVSKGRTGQASEYRFLTFVSKATQVQTDN
jgi:hypothetical protein